KAAESARVGGCVSGACNDLVTGNDAILDLHMMVGRYSEQVLEECDLSGETRRTSPRMLDVRLGEEFRKGAGIMLVQCCYGSIEQRWPDRGCFGPARCFSSQSLKRRQCCCAAY